MNIEIIAWDDSYAREFAEISLIWLKQYEILEPADLDMLWNPHDAILDHGGQIFFARVDGVIVGTAGMQPVVPGVYELVKLGVRPEYRRQGAGTLLVKACLDWAAQQKAARITLYSNKKLVDALRLYERLGFVEKPFVRGHYEMSDVWLELSL